MTPTPGEPVPKALKESLTIDPFLPRLPVFVTEADRLGRYCQVMFQRAISGSLTPPSPTEERKNIKNGNQVDVLLLLRL